MKSRFGSQSTTGRSQRGLRLLLGMVWFLTGCGSSTEPPTATIGSGASSATAKPTASSGASPTASPSPTGSTATLRKWVKPIVCQPHLIKADGNDAHQGTGFFVRTPGGKIAAVSSAHFLDFAGSPVVSAEWLQFPNHEPVATFTASWGTPGREGDDRDLTSDYWIMPVADEHVPSIAERFEVLEFDPRPRPNNGERIWLPNKDPRATLGFVPFDGRVLTSSDGIISVELVGSIKLQSQSGSPIISRQTHKVIGTLCSGAEQNDKTFLWLAPVAKMRAVVDDESQFPPLRQVIGKQGS